MSGVILYIEDNKQNMRLVRKMLQIGHYEMLEATDGFEGFEVAKAEKPDLILMDINIPGMDGLETTAAIKSDPEIQHIPIVALTADAMFGDRERFLDAGCDGYLAKPISKRELLSTIAEYLKPDE